jgi:hypothetical protein
MANFYYGSDRGQAYWINLDQVCFVVIEPDKLILKMIDGNAITIDEEDYYSLKRILWIHTVNADEEYKDNDKRHNHEDVPTREEVEASNDIFKPEDWEPKDCDLDDDKIPF